MKKDFETLFSELDKESIKTEWEEAKRENKKRNKILISIIVIVDVLFLFIAFVGGINTNKYTMIPMALIGLIPVLMRNIFHGFFGNCVG